MYQIVYYVSYLAICAALIFWLARILNRSGAVFLNEAFHGNALLVSSVGQLLNIGFYLMSFGYLTMTIPNYETLHNFLEVGEMVIGKLGGFLLLLGVVHLFNLLLLAIFRRRTVIAAPAS